MESQIPKRPLPTSARKPIRGSFIAQVAVGIFLRLHRSDWGIGLRPLFRGLLKIIGKTDRLVRIEVGGNELVIPVTHPLPLERAINPGFLQQFGRIARAATSVYPSMTGIMINPEYGIELAIIRSQTAIPLLGCSRDANQYLILNRNMLHVENIDTSFIPSQDCLSAEWVQRHAERYANANWIVYKADRVSQVNLTEWIQNHVILTIEWQRIDDINLTTLCEALIQHGYTATILFDYTGHYVTTVQLTDTVPLMDLATYLTRAPQHGGTATFFHANHAECLRTFVIEERLLGRRTSSFFD